MLAIIETHPIQYHVPIWRQVARNGRVPFEVWYLTAHGVQPSLDQQFGQTLQWDIPMLEGYPYRFAPGCMAKRLGRLWELGLGSAFRLRLRSGAIDAVLVPGWLARACWETVFLSQRAGLKVWMRGDSNDLKVDRGVRRTVKRWALAQMLARVDRFLCVGEANRRLYLGYGISEERLTSGPHCVDNARFAAESRLLRPQRQSLREAWGIPDNAFCLLFAGKFISKKRPLDLVAAVKRLAENSYGPKFHILFVGAGELSGEVRRQCRVVYDVEGGSLSAERRNDSSSEPGASFAGFLNQSEIARAYVAADALVLPSDEGETWGLVVNEAMASGLPCLVSRACGCAEDLVQPLDPRLTFPCGDINGLAQSISWLVNNPLPADVIAKRIARYDVSATVSTLEGLWGEVGK